MDIDEIFLQIGEFGRYQILLLLVMFTLNMCVPFHMLQIVFTGAKPSFTCRYKNNLLYDQCFNGSASNCKFTYTSKFTSIATEWNLVCDESFKVESVQSVFMAGVMVGALFLGSLSDMIGRLKTLYITTLGMVIFSMGSAFSPNYLFFIILRFMNGVFVSGVILSAYVLGSELVGGSKRDLIGTLFQSFFAVGVMLFSGLAAVLPDWKTLIITTTSICSLFLGAYCFVPESPRWLLTQGYVDESRQVLNKIAVGNGKNPIKQIDLKVPSIPKKSSAGVRSLFTYSVLRNRTLIQIYSWFVNSCVYYGLTMSSGDLGMDLYSSEALSGAVEIPAYILSYFLLVWLGRRWTLAGFMLFGGVSCLCIPLASLSSFAVGIKTALALAGKLSIAASFSVVYIHSCELFPTVIRNLGMGVVSVSARLGGVVSPVVMMLNKVRPDLHFVAFGGLMFTAGLLNLLLPETLNRPLPETVEELLVTPRTEKPGFQYTAIPTGEQVERVRQILENEKESDFEDELFNRESIS